MSLIDLWAGLMKLTQQSMSFERSMQEAVEIAANHATVGAMKIRGRMERFARYMDRRHLVKLGRHEWTRNMFEMIEWEIARCCDSTDNVIERMHAHLMNGWTLCVRAPARRTQ
jgi:hypothetical protein